MHSEKVLLDLWHQDRLKNWKSYFDSLAEIIVKKYKPDIILDVGCSDGLLLESFRKLKVTGYGVDISKKSMLYAPKEIRSGLILTDIEISNLPFKDETFDLVTILEVLEHLHNYERIIREIYRVLKPGGFVLMSTPAGSKAYNTLSKPMKKIISFCGKFNSNNIKDYEVCEFSPHINVHPKKFWISVFETAGFELVEDVKKSQKNLIKSTIIAHEPTEPIAKLFVKFGMVGKYLRVQLAYNLWSTTLIFKK